MLPVRFRTGPEILKLRRKIEEYIKHYVPNATIKFVYHPLLVPFVAHVGFPHRKGEPFRFEFNERYLEWLPEEEVWDTVNHEIAHVLAFTGVKRETKYIGGGHGIAWIKFAKIMGAEPNSRRKWARVLTKRGIYTIYPRYLFKCRKCGILFFTSGGTDSKARFDGEPDTHPLDHTFFYVTDILSGRRGVIYQRAPFMNEGDFPYTIEFYE